MCHLMVDCRFRLCILFQITWQFQQQLVNSRMSDQLGILPDSTRLREMRERAMEDGHCVFEYNLPETRAEDIYICKPMLGRPMALEDQLAPRQRAAPAVAEQCAQIIATLERHNLTSREVQHQPEGIPLGSSFFVSLAHQVGPGRPFLRRISQFLCCCYCAALFDGHMIIVDISCASARRCGEMGNDFLVPYHKNCRSTAPGIRHFSD